MSKKYFLFFLVLLVVPLLLLTGCPAEEEEEDPEAVDLEGKTLPLPDEVILQREESPAAAVQQLMDGDFDIYAHSINDPDLYEDIVEHEELQYDFNYGSYSELAFNHYGPHLEDGSLNPFHSPKFREAINWLIDRNYMVEEYLGGMGEPRYTMLGPSFPDYDDRYPDLAAELEDYYAHDPDRAEEIMTGEMEEFGAELVDGTWHYEGEPVELIFLLRADLAPWPDAGHYVADKFEDMGFTIERMERTGDDASPLYTGSHPAEGEFHVYTGGWVSTTISRCQAHNFDQMYTHRVMPWPIFDTLEPQLTEEFPELDEASDKLRHSEFTTMEEREELFEKVLWESLKFSPRIFVMDVAGANPYRTDVEVAADVAGGIVDPAWPYTAHLLDEDGQPKAGGTLNVAMPNIYVDPWNPVEGSAFVYDNFATNRAIGDWAFLRDPRDGLDWPMRIEKAEVHANEDLPIDVTHDWVDLIFEEEIEVPGDAWADWDAEAQEFVTAEEKFGEEGATALIKSVVHYDDDIFEHPLHDGSTLSMGDFIMGVIMHFDRGKEDSSIFCKAEEAELEAWLDRFKGMRIVSEEPLVIEHYTNNWSLDAEWCVGYWWPDHGTYDWSIFWHMLVPGWKADAAGDVVFSESKADDLGVDWMSYTSGESLDYLEEHLVEAAADNYIPYETVLGDYISEEEAEERYSNLQEFYEEWGHFWVGAGPYFIKNVHPVEDMVHLKAFEDYPDPYDRWFFLNEPLD